MAELSLKQIADKLNAEFSGGSGRRIFWFDARSEFAEDIERLPLEHAKLYRLRENEQFRAKYFLEREDPETNYLIYAPFPRPPVERDHLADMIHYSREFFADRATLIVLELNMDERCKPIIQHYGKFFASKDCFNAFRALDIAVYNRAGIEIGMMAVLCKLKFPSFEEVLRCVLAKGDLDDEQALADFARYDLTDAFWEHCARSFGYTDTEPTLSKLVMTLFVTAAQHTIRAEIPDAWRRCVSIKSGSIAAFLNNLMNNVLYAPCFDALSARVYREMDVGAWLSGQSVEAYMNCALFAGVDELLIRWLIERLLAGETGALTDGATIPELCERREKTHFGMKRADAYGAIRAAWYLIREPAVEPLSDLKAIVQRYTRRDFEADRMYRFFYFHLDRMEDAGAFEALRARVEGAYQDKFLNPLCANYALAFAAGDGETGLASQRDFYRDHVQPSQNRVVVIISDALRYEVGVSLYEALALDEKCSVQISALRSVLPSITSVGMAALLPHRALRLNDAGGATVDGSPTAELVQREAVLRRENDKSRAVQFDELRGMSVDQLREIFTGQKVVYIYHNQIDARGDKAVTQNEVFAACEEAIDEIRWLIRRLTTCANVSRFIVTADHGFIYKRDRLTESDKIPGSLGARRRHVITAAPLRESGVSSFPLGRIYGDGEARYINFPVGSDVFRAPASSQNFVHGGCSPQEMIIPLLQVKTEKARRETDTAKIDLVSLGNKITNLIATLDFVQTEPVSDVVKAAKYRICFVTAEGECISNENTLDADRRDRDTTKRMFRLGFIFKNRRYDPGRRYYLVARDESNDLEVLRREFTIDMAFVDEFGF